MTAVRYLVMPSRRAVLLSVAVLLAGCSTGNSGDQRTVLDTDIDLEAGDYRAVEFELEEKRTVEFGASGFENTEIDILFLSREEFAAFSGGEAFEPLYTSGLAVSGGSAEDTVPAGEYVVVFDNTPRSEATPDGRSASGHVRVEILPAN
jgi:hypothetical protein